MFTGDTYNYFGILGERGPRALRPRWFKSHFDSVEGWRVFVRPDDEDGSRGEVTGRRDHFIANAFIGHVGGIFADAYFAIFNPETSKNDLIYNQLGRNFGEQIILRSTISQSNIGGWIVSNMAP